MRKIVAFVLALVMCLPLCACGEKEKSPDEILKETLVGEWVNVYNCDVFVFNADGTGTHDGAEITYRCENEIIYITEGITSVEEKKYTLITVSNDLRLLPESKDSYYATRERYDVIEEQMRAEYTAILTSYEYWSNTQGLNYVMFSANGGGWFLLSGTTLVMSWEWVDNNTIKMSIDNNGTIYTNVVTIANTDEGPYLIDDVGVILYTPKNPL